MKVIPEKRHAQKFDVHVWVLQLLSINTGLGLVYGV
jgi:hypothetical protein